MSIETPATEVAETVQTDTTVTAESLIEEVSIDGMCGVY
ncbi:mycofactocin precursor [Aeromicrobium sp. CFBP 8757]|nr:mycofactocin precursor MftA [Aeromicrobium sp. CFBP 8757]MBD8608797.1 mycofactocin precursor [Aeromicrobium sp. CFBP 8757]